MPWGIGDFYKSNKLSSRIANLVHEEPVWNSKTFSPSDIDQCSLYLYYKMIGEKGVRQVPYALKKRQRRGIESEKYLLLDIEQAGGVIIDKQKKVYCDDPPIYGKVDAIIEEDGVQKIIEHTTKDFFVYKKLTAPPENKVRQWNIYAGLTGIHTGYVTVDNWDEFNEFAWFEVTFNQEMFDACMEKFRRVWQCVKTQTPPEPEDKFYYGSSDCLSCPYLGIAHDQVWYSGKKE